MLLTNRFHFWVEVSDDGEGFTHDNCFNKIGEIGESCKNVDRYKVDSWKWSIILDIRSRDRVKFKVSIKVGEKER
jgi:hypothetical protein